MDLKTKKTSSLPKEIAVYKKIYISSIDPIKKEIFSFNEIATIMNSTVAFPVKAKDYYRLKYEVQEKEQLIAILAMSYIAYRSYTENKTTEVLINENDLLYIMKFINKFYQFDIPLRDRKDENILWIYPKLKIKKFLSDCISNKEKTRYYFDEIALTKLILIMTSFVRYEYNNSDEEVEDQLKALNFPTLILANISLYEKGHLKITNEPEGIGISFNLCGLKKRKKIFTRDINTLKKKIITILKYTEGKTYCLNDFME